MRSGQVVLIFVVLVIFAALVAIRFPLLDALIILFGVYLVMPPLPPTGSNRD